MKRRLDWPERMNEALERAQSRAFSESYHCAQFAADVVLAMTDVDPLPVRHDTVAAAYAHMRDTHARVEEALAAIFGDPIHPAHARRGDVVLSENGAIGICMGQRSAFISSSGGLEYEPTLEQVSVYRVPFDA